MYSLPNLPNKTNCTANISVKYK